MIIALYGSIIEILRPTLEKLSKTDPHELRNTNLEVSGWGATILDSSRIVEVVTEGGD